MKEISINEIFELLNNKKLNYNNFYNTDVEAVQYEAVEYYNKYQHDNIDKEQNLHIVFNDIECYLNHGNFIENKYEHPINAITLYSDIEKIYHTFVLLNNIVLKQISIKDEEKIKNKIKEELINENDLESDEDLKVYFYTDELTLIKNWCNTLRKIDPIILSGFNSDFFDYPYIYFRLVKLTNKNEAQKLLSRFETIKVRQVTREKFNTIANIIEIPEYVILDILKLFKPREDEGLNYGKKLPSYSLEFVSNFVLGSGKLNYKDSGLTLDKLYEEDTINFIKYNIIDVVRTKQLNEKLKHIELHNLIRRDMKTPLQYSVRGSSAIFDTYFTYILNKKNEKFRHGFISENIISLNESDLLDCQKPKTNKVNWKLKSIDIKLAKKIIMNFPGAYVKSSSGSLVENKDQVPVDLDASSLYPSMIQQYNISFETFYGRIIDPLSYNILNNLDQIIFNKNNITDSFCESIFKNIYRYVDEEDIKKKNETIELYYYIIINCINKLKKAKRNILQLLEPKTKKDYLILKLYLLPLLDLIAEIHPGGHECNSSAYNYIINNEVNNKIDHIYIIENITSPKIKINKIKNTIEEINKYIKEKNLILTIAGTLFYKHDENKKGIIPEFCKVGLSMRKFYQKKYDEEKDEILIKYYDNRQKTMKTRNNSVYGLLGLSSFRFSNHWIAKSVTLPGRLSLKIAQSCAEMYLRNLLNEEQIK